MNIQDQWLLFYSADKHAFGGWWIGGLLGICAVLVVFVLIFRKISRQNNQRRYSSRSIYNKFVRSYKRKYWYWEFVIFSRRFFVSAFTALQFVGGRYVDFIFAVVLMIYLGLQIHFKPFAYQRVNQIETLCLGLLNAAFIAANLIREDDEDAFVSWILYFCMIAPLFVISFHVVSSKKALRAKRKHDATTQGVTDKLLDGMPNTPREKVTLLRQASSGNIKQRARKSLNTFHNRKDGLRREKFRVALIEYINYSDGTLPSFGDKRAEIHEMIEELNHDDEKKPSTLHVHHGTMGSVEQSRSFMDNLTTTRYRRSDDDCLETELASVIARGTTRETDAGDDTPSMLDDGTPAALPSPSVMSPIPENTSGHEDEPDDRDRENMVRRVERERAAVCADDECVFADYETVPTDKMEDTSRWSEEQWAHIRECHPDC